MSIAREYWKLIIAREPSSQEQQSDGVMKVAEEVFTEVIDSCAHLLEEPATGVALVNATTVSLRTFRNKGAAERLINAFDPVAGQGSELLDLTHERLDVMTDHAERMLRTLQAADEPRTTMAELDEAMTYARNHALFAAAFVSEDEQARRLLEEGKLTVGAVLRIVLTDPPF